MEKEFTELIESYKYCLIKICNTFFYRHLYAEDFLQEIIIRLWKAYPTFRGESSVKTWLYRIALNTSIDILRKQIIMPKLQSISDKEYQLQESNHWSVGEDIDFLYGLINQLSENDKSLIILYLDEFSYKEISEITGLSQSNVGVKISRIKKQLKTIMDNGNN
ncbi:MAG: RNA polymerase sigma factor [Mucinivorans sp.]